MTKGPLTAETVEYAVGKSYYQLASIHWANLNGVRCIMIACIHGGILDKKIHMRVPATVKPTTDALSIDHENIEPTKKTLSHNLPV
jgi:hypothetical protein